ncbi:unknown [Rickettsia conorii str. Malish 7]|uniref:YhcG N-terminal domain-containing protein n=2 Tax=Rickettsia conorii TaxID=781 RepID=Q92HN2_RICCN|nr:unknown [Rickettsia conorii str. Malish 7]
MGSKVIENISYMRQFAEEYNDEQIPQQSVGEIPWGYHIVIVSKVKNHTERLWYVCTQNYRKRLVT